MSPNSTYEFVGDGKRRGKKTYDDCPAEMEPYISSSELIQAVNLSIMLRRPLLIEGEAGCGKSRLARAVAYELGLPLYTWHIKSTSKAQDGLYTYDTLLRLHDVHTSAFAEKSGKKAGDFRDPGNPENYRRYGALGKAFINEHPSVVLIDEIDKADIDFPNDLLTVLDDPWSFEIPETKQVVSVKKENRPIVIITSNKEKGNLPFPFLRRCVYFYLAFPDTRERLEEIVNIHYHSREAGSSYPFGEILEPAIEKFLSLRQDRGLFKKPGTSELLDWLKALESESYDRTNFVNEIEDSLPFPGALIKLRVDWENVTRHFK